jgi:hypothetical protein
MLTLDWSMMGFVLMWGGKYYDEGINILSPSIYEYGNAFI